MAVNRVLRAFWAALLAISVSAAWASAANQASAPKGVTRTSRPVRLLRSWEETVKVDGREYPRRVRVLFDYAKGSAREESYDTRGVLRASRQISEGLPAPSPEEIAEAFDVVRTDPGLSTLFARFAVVLEGGFLLEEEPGMPCGPGSRCLHVFLLSSDRAGLIRRVVVDLVPRSIAYPLYTPAAIGSHER